jgi:hypothetical protein
MTNQVLVNDPFMQAEDPAEIKYSNEYWGEVCVDAFFCILEKGVGKVPFNEQQHSIDKRLTAVKIGIIPVPASNLQFDVERDYIAEFRDWNAITLPSLKALGVSLRELNGKFAHAKLTETGETYVNKMGETKEKTVFEFLEIYGSLEDCEAAYIAKKGDNGRTPASAVPPITSSNNPVSKGGAREKEAAEKFLKVAVKSACAGKTDLDQAREAVAEQIAKMPMISKHFTIDSPETMNAMAEVMGG